MNQFLLRTAPALAAAACFFSASAAHAQTPVKIGFLGELSGPQSAVGQDQYDSFMLVVERNGGKLGGVPVQILKEDSQLKPEVANQAVRLRQCLAHVADVQPELAGRRALQGNRARDRRGRAKRGRAVARSQGAARGVVRDGGAGERSVSAGMRASASSASSACAR